MKPVAAATLLLSTALAAGCLRGPSAPHTAAPTAVATATSEAALPSATTQPAATHTATAEPTAAPTQPLPPATPTPTASPDPCWDAGGRVERFTLATDLSPWPWEFRVYTPPCYDEEYDRHYPVLILIHGSTYTDSQWDDLGADEAADRLIASGEAPPFIILMPRDRVWVEPEADPFGEALVTRILPWLDENFRTIPDRRFRAIGGLSRGASWSVHLGLKHWELFGAIGAHSLPVFVTDPTRIRAWLDEIPFLSLPRIYLDIGDRDYLLDKALWFENLLTERGIPHEWHLNPGRHEDAYWQSHLDQYLLWYSLNW